MAGLDREAPDRVVEAGKKSNTERREGVGTLAEHGSSREGESGLDVDWGREDDA